LGDAQRQKLEAGWHMLHAALQRIAPKEIEHPGWDDPPPRVPDLNIDSLTTSKRKDTVLAANNAPPNPSVDPIEQTALALGRAVSKIKLLQFLAARENRRAELTTIARDLYAKKLWNNKGTLKNTRRQVEQARDKLVERNCPLRILISGNVVRLIDADPVV
jgi:hypothetical protein